VAAPLRCVLPPHPARRRSSPPPCGRSAFVCIYDLLLNSACFLSAV
jgi:hypothetical protein